MYPFGHAFEIFLESQGEVKSHCMIGTGFAFVGLRGRYETKIRPKLEKMKDFSKLDGPGRCGKLTLASLNRLAERFNRVNIESRPSQGPWILISKVRSCPLTIQIDLELIICLRSVGRTAGSLGSKKVAKAFETRHCFDSRTPKLLVPKSMV